MDIKAKKVNIEGMGDMIAMPKNFSTGSRGFYAGGKLEEGGKRYQVSLSIVEIGSKNPAAAKGIPGVNQPGVALGVIPKK